MGLGNQNNTDIARGQRTSLIQQKDKNKIAYNVTLVELEIRGERKGMPNRQIGRSFTMVR